ncbi:MAG: FHA domain-containing protein [Lachnospiraceae bacterium]|nr:FHA domain-containing protein [Lachnospiraceae bacterium]
MKRFYKRLIVILVMCCLISNTAVVNVGAFESAVMMENETEEVTTEKTTEVTTEKTTETTTEKTTEATTEKTTETTETTTEKTTEATTEKTTEVTTETTTEKTTEVTTEKNTDTPKDDETEKTTEAAKEEKNDSNTQTTTAPAVSQTTGGTNSGSSNSSPATTEEATTEEVDPRESYTVHNLVAEEGKIEQVQAIKPKVRAFFYLNDETVLLTPDNVEAKLGDSKVSVDKIYKWGQEGNLYMNYYVLLDVSGSMNDDYFDAAKTEIAHFPAKHMKVGDTITVYAVGDTTELIVDTGTYNEMRDIEDKVMSLTNEADETYLDQAIIEVVEDVKENREASGNELPQSRDVIITFTDGVNESMVGATQNEAEVALKNSGITMYGFLEDDAEGDNSEAAKKFGEIARNTGGQEYTFNADDVAEKIADLCDKLQDVYVLEGMAQDNEMSNTLESFFITIFHDANQQILVFEGKDVLVDKYIPDSTPPQVEYIKMLDDTKLEIKYSESVINAGDRASYVITKDTGENIGIENVQYKDKDDVYVLYASETLYKGTYTIVINGVTDKTMEKNPLAQPEYTQEFDGPEYVEEKESFFQKYWWIILVAFLLVLILIIVIVFRVIKKNKGVVVIDNKATLASNTDVKQHIILQNEEEGEKLTLVLSSKGKSVKTIQANVKGSVIVGRSDLCDIYIDDLAMSRQHFAIEYDGESFYVQDLDTTNGTSLNGIRLKHKRRLEPNDKITAGSLDITVRW